MDGKSGVPVSSGFEVRCVGLHLLYFIHRITLACNMTKGVSVTSSIITISGRTVETAPGIMLEEEIPLSLDVLNREVLLVYAIDINPFFPDAITATDVSISASLSSTSRTTMGRIGNTNVLGVAETAIRAAGFVDGGVSFEQVSPETPTANALDYVGIISTNNFFVQVQGTNNLTVKGCNWRIWCARARVTADIYAALVQGEALSA